MIKKDFYYSITDKTQRFFNTFEFNSWCGFNYIEMRPNSFGGFTKRIKNIKDFIQVIKDIINTNKHLE